MKIITFLIILPCLFYCLCCCSSSKLTREEKDKLDLPLQKLVSGETINENMYNIYIAADGTKRYGIIIRSSDPEAIRQAGVEINSVYDDIITAKLTLNEIRKITALPAVITIQNTSKSYTK